MKKLITKIRQSLMQSTTKVRWMLLTKTEKRMMGLSAHLTEQYTRSRTFRRTMEGTPLGDAIKQTIKDWNS